MIFASTDNDEKTKNVGEYLEIVKTAYDEYDNRKCIQETTRKSSLDKAEKIAEQFLEERKKRHEDMEKELDHQKREKTKEDWEEKVEWTVPRAATEVLLERRLFKYVAFGVLFSVVLICLGCPCVFSSSWAYLVLLWSVKAILVVVLISFPFQWWIGKRKNPSFLKNLPVCWDVIIEIEREYELEHKEPEKDINEMRKIDKAVEKKIGKCMKKHK